MKYYNKTTHEITALVINDHKIEIYRKMFLEIKSIYQLLEENMPENI